MLPLSVFTVNLLSENLLLLASILVFMAILITKVGSKLGTPALLLFLLLGMAVGQDGLGVRFEDYKLAESIGHFAMTIILFAAGFETSVSETKPILKQGVLLSTLALVLTVAITGVFIWLVAGGKAGGFGLMACFLLAAVMSSTDSASVFSVLREKKLRLKENLGPLLELESGSNDPIAYMITIALVGYLLNGGAEPAGSAWSLVLSGFLLLLAQILVGLAIGLATGYAAKWVLESVHFSGALTSILILSIGFFSNGVATFLHGNGLLACYLAAIIIGNKVKLDNKKVVYNFFDGFTWLMQLVMFLMLGLLARPSHMIPVLLPSLLIGLFMMFVARPVGVFLCLLPFKNTSFRAKTLVSWVGLKGAGPILFALCPIVAGLPGATDMFNIVFLITLFSLLLQGGTLGKVAGRLRLSDTEPHKAQTFGMEVPEEMGQMRDHVVTPEDLVGGASLRAIHLPHGIRVMMVRRDGKFLVPHGSMELVPGDHLIIIEGESDD